MSAPKAFQKGASGSAILRSAMFGAVDLDQFTKNFVPQPRLMYSQALRLVLPSAARDQSLAQRLWGYPNVMPPGECLNCQRWVEVGVVLPDQRQGIVAFQIAEPVGCRH